jgi:hypothetical protein
MIKRIAILTLLVSSSVLSLTVFDTSRTKAKVISVFGRKGTVVATTNDYSFSQLGGFIQSSQMVVVNPLIYNQTNGHLDADTSAGNTHLATQAYVLSHAGGLVAADSVLIRNYSNSLYLKNADSISIRNYSTLIYAPKASPTFTGTVTTPLGTGTVRSSSGGVLSATASDTVGLGTALGLKAALTAVLKNADSTSIRDYSTSLYDLKDHIGNRFYDSTGIADNKIIKYNSTLGKWIVRNDSLGSGGSFTWKLSGQAAVNDSLRFVEGTNVTMSQSGNALTINSAGGSSSGIGNRAYDSTGLADDKILKYNSSLGKWILREDSGKNKAPTLSPTFTGMVNAETLRVVSSDNNTPTVEIQNNTGSNVAYALAVRSQGWYNFAVKAGGQINIQNTYTGTLRSDTGRLYTTASDTVGLGTALFGKVSTSAIIGLAKGGTNVDLSAAGSATAFLAEDASHVISARSITTGDVPTLNQNTTGTANITGGTLGAIPYQSGANATTVLAATATAGQMLRSGASAAPGWSTNTFPNTAATGDILTATSTNAIGVIAVQATANKMLLSGANAVSSYSTSTIPSSAGSTAGKHIKSDATNYVLTTLVWPDVAPAAGAFPRGNASNFVTSTLTLPDAATTGDVVVATATNALGVVAAIPRGGSVLLSGLSAVPTWSSIRLYQDSTVASDATPIPQGYARFNKFDMTALATAPTFGIPSGTATNHNELLIRIKDNAAARVLSWNAIYRASTDLALPAITIISKTMYLKFEYNGADSKWDLLAVGDNY